MAVTLFVGMLMGALVVALINKAPGRHGNFRQNGKEAIIQKILGVIEADPSQETQIRPYILETMSDIDSLQRHTDDQMRFLIDSFEMKVQPWINENQMEQLRQFHKRVRNR